MYVCITENASIFFKNIFLVKSFFKKINFSFNRRLRLRLGLGVFVFFWVKLGLGVWVSMSNSWNLEGKGPCILLGHFSRSNRGLEIGVVGPLGDFSCIGLCFLSFIFIPFSPFSLIFIALLYSYLLIFLVRQN